MLRVLVPGSFDPPTNGHLNIIHRAAAIYDEVIVIVAQNTDKHYAFSAGEREEMLRTLLEPYKNVAIKIWEGLIVEYARKVSARIIVRGVRALSDFSYEFELSMLNKALNRDIETIFIPTDPEYFVLRSSAIKEIVQLGGDVSHMVPPLVKKRLQKLLTKIGLFISIHHGCTQKKAF